MKPKRYTEQVNVAMSPETKARLDEIAQSQDKSMSEYAREAIEARLWDDHAKKLREAKQ